MGLAKEPVRKTKRKPLVVAKENKYIRCEYTKLVDPKTLKPNPENPNEHSDSQISRLAKTLKYQGFRKPIVVSNQTGFIATGHATTLAAIQNGWKLVPVSFQDFKNYDQEYAHVVADNALGQWSKLNLSGINAKIGDLGPMDIELLGLENFVIDPADLPDATPEGFDKPDEKIQSDTVRKITLLYSADAYKDVTTDLLLLSQYHKTTNLSDLIALLIKNAVNDLQSN